MIGEEAKGEGKTSPEAVSESSDEDELPGVPARLLVRNTCKIV